MDYKYIEQLLDRYFDGLTSTAEEQILKIFFSQQDIPAHLEAYADIFRFAAEERAAEKLGEGMGAFLSALYTELRGDIGYVYEGRDEYITIGIVVHIAQWC